MAEDIERERERIVYGLVAVLDRLAQSTSLFSFEQKLLLGEELRSAADRIDHGPPQLTI